jgi:hypothetical protein
VKPTGVVVVYDVSCPNCSRIARELPELVRVPVTVRSCRDPQLKKTYPGLAPQVRSCGAPAVGIVRADGRIRWWTGLSGAIGLLPLLRPRELPEAVALLGTALRARG